MDKTLTDHIIIKDFSPKKWLDVVPSIFLINSYMTKLQDKSSNNF